MPKECLFHDHYNKIIEIQILWNVVKLRDVQKLIFQDAHGVIMYLLPKILGV